MKENLKKHTKRIRNLVITLVLTALILTVSTYAWFIGMRTVTVNEFSVEIATTKELELSLDGKKWSDNVSINKENYNNVNVVYSDHTNWWAGEGLIPMSSVGEIDDDVSRLILYEKSSLTQSAGGYRIMTSRAENDNEENGEVDGYVAFDLFIRNHSGADYIVNLDDKNEEAIYLSVDSTVKVSDTDGVQGTGIENSVRVAFAQIGRVKGTFADDVSGASTITAISCLNDTNVTGICTRTAQIWEPNDKDHVPGAISWYETACRTRTNATTFDGPCSGLEDREFYPTYAVANEIDATDGVDVYDGGEYNGYTATISATADESALLYKYPTFRDTHKLQKGMDRPLFMTLAPNSVTKVRVYVWIEGQDVDNYDFAAIGKAISVKFGFTKQRFTEEDFGYTGPTAKPTTTTTTVPTTTQP